MSQLKQRLLGTTDAVTTLAGKCVTGGRLNVNSAVRNRTNSSIWAGISFPYDDASTQGLKPASANTPILGVAYSPQFVRYTLEAGLGSTPSSWGTTGITLVNNGNTAIPDNGKLADWNAPATVDGIWSLRLTVYSQTGSKQVLRQVWVDRYLRTGFPAYSFETSGSYVSGANSIYALVADLNGDGHKELLATGLANGPLYAWDSQGNLLPGWPVDGGGAAYAAAKDVDGSGHASVAAVFYGGNLNLLDASGNNRQGWPVLNPNFGSTAPTMPDLAGDGGAEVIVNMEDWYVHAYKSNGTELPGWPKRGASGQRIPATAAGDLLGDGSTVVLAYDGYSSAGLYIQAWRKDGTSVPGWPKQISGSSDIIGGLALGDVTGDGALKVAVTSAGGIHVLLPNGTEAPGWPFAISGSGRATPPALADLDGDGIPEIVFATESYSNNTASVYALKGNGTVLAGWPQACPSGYNWMANFAPVVGDINGDGSVDVVMGYQYPGNGSKSALVAYSTQGVLLSGFPKYVQAGGGSVPAIADLDGTGRNQLILMSSAWTGQSGPYPKIFVWDFSPAGSQAGPTEWGQLRNDSGHTGLYRNPKLQAPIITSARTASGAVGTAFSYTIRATGSPTSFNASGLPPGLDVNTGNGLISGTPTAAGTFSVPISATNSHGTGSATLLLTISDPNAPVIVSTAPASPFTMYASAAQDFSATATSPTGSGLSYSWQLDSVTVGTNQPLYHYAPQQANVGSHLLQITVTDTNGRATIYGWQVKVLDPSPVIGSTTPTTPFAMYATTAQDFSATATSPIGSALSYSWKLDSAAAGTNQSTYHYATVQADVGGHVLQITVTDAAGRAASYSWQITVVNPVPVISASAPASPFSMQAGTVQDFSVTATSPIGSALGYAWTLDSASVGSDQATYHYTPGQSDVGNHALQVTVTDASGRPASCGWQIAVWIVDPTGGSWPTMGNGPAHTSYVPINLSNATMTADWSATLGTVAIPQVVVGQSIVYAVVSTGYMYPCSVVAKDVTSGNTIWTRSLGNTSNFGGATYADGKVFVQQVSASEAGTLFALDAATGNITWSSTWAAQWDTYYAPAVTNGCVYIGGGTGGGMYGFDESTGTQKFFTAFGGGYQCQSWTPAVWNGRLFSWVEYSITPSHGTFREHNPTSGAELWNQAFSGNLYTYQMKTVPAIDSGYAYIIDGDMNGGKLHCINLTSRSEAWSATGPYKWAPALAGGGVYAIGTTKVDAFSISNGQLVRTYTADTTLTWQPIVTQDTLLVASTSKTYLFNLSDGSLRQTVPYGGRLSLTSTRLYIATDSGALKTYKPFVNHPPVITSVQAAPNPAVAGQPVAFSVAASDQDNDPLTYNWTFGDNTNGTGAAPTHTYAVAGTYSATVTVTDGHGGSAPASVSVVVNPAPTYVLTVNSGSGSGTYTAGTIVSIAADRSPTGMFFDKWIGSSAIADVKAASTTITMPAADTTITATYRIAIPPLITSPTTASVTEGMPFSYQITAMNNPTSYGTTNLPAWASMNASGLITGTPTFPGLAQITLTATNGDGTGYATLALTVINVPPALSNVTLTTQINENDVATLSGTFFDPGTAETFTLTVDWGDGSAPQTFPYAGASTAFSQTHRYRNNPSGTPSGTFTVNATLSDNYGGAANTRLPIVVNNVPPTIRGVTLSQPMILENQSVGLTGAFTDPGTLDAHLVLIDWGDGQQDPLNLDAQIYAIGPISHKYLNSSPSQGYNITVTVSDDDGGSDSVVEWISVVAVPPVPAIVGVPGTIAEGTLISLTSTVSGPGSLDTFTYGWLVVKDGVPYAIGTAAGFSFTPDKEGAYVVTLTVTDENGGMGTDHASIVATNVAPTVAILGAPASSPEGTHIVLTCAVTDPGSADTFSYAWNVTKDGIVYASGSDASFTFTPDDNATYVVSLKVIDDDGGVGDAGNQTITVTNVNPTAAIVGAPATSPEGRPIALACTIADPGVLDTFTYAWSVTKDGNPCASGYADTFSFTPDDNASYVVSLTVTDKDGGVGVAGNQTITVTNVAPAVAILGAPATSPEGTPIALTCTVADPGVLDTFTYAWSVTKDGDPYASGFDADFSFTPDDNASYVVSLTVTDKDGGLGMDTKTITVTNVAPTVAIVGAPDTSPEGTPLALTCTVSDPGVLDTFAYAWSVTKDGSPYTSGLDADFSFTPDDNAVYVVSLAVTDKDGGVGVAENQTITVTNVNPAAAIIGVPTTSPEGRPIALTCTVADPGVLDTFTYAWSVTKDGNPCASGYADTFSFTPDDNASYVVSLTVTDKDGGVGVAEDQTITATNVAPAVAILGAPATSPEGTPIALRCTVADPGMLDTFTYAWSVTKDGDPYASGYADTFSFTPDDNASYVVSLTVTDKDGGVGVAENQTITVTNVNPTVAIVGAPDSSIEGTAIALSANSSDPGTLDTLTLAWRVTKNGVPFATGSMPSFTFMPDGHGLYAITLTATDKDGGSGSDSKTIVVLNSAPSVVILGAPVAIKAGTTVNLTSAVTDAGQADTFTYYWHLTKGGVPGATGTAAAFSFTPSEDAVYAVTLTVTDDGGATATDSKTIVSQAPPVILSGPLADINPAKPLQVVHFTCQATDADAINWKWDFGDGTGDNSNSSSVQHAFTPTGTYTVTVTVTDANGLATVKTLTMMIDPTGGAAVPPGTELDCDGDGFSDVLEAALGSDPRNPASTPFGGAPAGPPQPISIKATALKLHFDAPGHDSIVVTGVLPVRVGLALEGLNVAVDVGGVVKDFTLDNKGVYAKGGDYFRLAMETKRGVVAEPRVRFRLQLTHGSFAATLAGAGFTAKPRVVSAVCQLRVTVLLDQTTYQQTRNVFWTSRNGVVGTGR